MLLRSIGRGVGDERARPQHVRLGAQGIEQGYEIPLHPPVAPPLARGFPDSVARRVLVLQDPAHISLGQWYGRCA
jgi:hypothetical protein